MVVSGTLPVLVSVNVWAGSRPHANICARLVPGQLRVWVGVHEVGVSDALTIGATAVPVSVTGEPDTVRLAVIVAFPLEEVTPEPGE